jgi:muconolactone delta-isomerase
MDEQIEDESTGEMPVVKIPRIDHAEVIKKYKEWKSAWAKVFNEYTSDMKFANGDQWDAKVKAARDKASLTSLVYNQLPSKYKYIVNNASKAVPHAKVHPVGDGATKNTAQLFDGLVIAAENRSNADSAYLTALKTTVIGGIGAWKVLPAKDDRGDFNVEYSRITDPTTVIMDPTATKEYFQDAEGVFVESWMGKELAKELSPDAQLEGISAKEKGMFNKKSILVLEYWCKNQETGYCEQYLLSGSEILHENVEYRGRKLPIVFLTGEEMHIEGERTYKGITRDVKDMQILLNLAKSKTADYIARAIDAQWKTHEASIPPAYKNLWLAGNVSGVPVLPYATAPDGSSPERLPPPPPPVGFMEASKEADADIRSAVGIRDPLQEIPASQSGKAIQLQISQSNIGTFEFLSKWGRAIQWSTEIAVDLIPPYYSYPHVREVMGMDKQITTVPIMQPFEENGEQVFHDLSKGTYGVTLSTGPSYESQREEAAEKLMQVATGSPELLMMIGDILFKNLDFKGADEIAARFQAKMDPALLAASNSTNGDTASQAASAQANAMQMQQQNAQLQEQLQQLQAMVQQFQAKEAAKVTEIQERGKVEASLKQMDHAHDLRMKGIDGSDKLEQIGAKTQGDITKIEVSANEDAKLQALATHGQILQKHMDHDLRGSVSMERGGVNE